MKYTLFCWFYGGIFISFGLGVALVQFTKEFPSGFIFIGVGFFLLIFSLFFNEQPELIREIFVKEQSSGDKK